VDIGYTFNFANKRFWVAVITIVGAVSVPLLLRAR